MGKTARCQAADMSHGKLMLRIHIAVANAHAVQVMPRAANRAFRDGSVQVGSRDWCRPAMQAWRSPGHIQPPCCFDCLLSVLWSSSLHHITTLLFRLPRICPLVKTPALLFAAHFLIPLEEHDIWNIPFTVPLSHSLCPCVSQSHCVRVDSGYTRPSVIV